MASLAREAEEWSRLAIAAEFKAGKLAEICGLSERHFRRELQQQLGCSPKELLVRVRLQVIRERLSAREPLKSICADAGLSDASSLCHFLKLHTIAKSSCVGVVKRIST